MPSLLKRILFAAGLALTVVLTGCEDDDPPPPPAASLAELVIADDNLSLFEEAVKQAGMMELLREPANLTLFAPENDAFGMVGIDLAAIAAMTTDEAKALVQYHIIEGKMISDDLPDGPNAMQEVYSGDSVFFTRTATDLFVNGVTLRQSDLDASNGIMHKTSGVLVPPGGSILETIQATTETLDSLVKAIGRVINEPGGDASLEATLSNELLTAFAPSNQAFSDLLDSLTLTDINEIPIAQLTEIVRYQFAGGRFFSPNLQDGPLNMLTGTTAQVSISGVAPTITGTGNGDDRSTITTVNIAAHNGVIQYTDRVLIP